MKRLLMCLVGLLSLYACLPADSQQQKDFKPAQLEGTWYLNRADLYHTLHFQDSANVALDSHIDTMFFYQYRLHKDTMFLYEKDGKPINYNIILKLTTDSLVFENLLDNAGIQRYSKVKKF
jgi:hypothetical protein